MGGPHSAREQVPYGALVDSNNRPNFASNVLSIRVPVRHRVPGGLQLGGRHVPWDGHICLTPLELETYMPDPPLLESEREWLHTGGLQAPIQTTPRCDQVKPFQLNTIPCYASSCRLPSSATPRHRARLLALPLRSSDASTKPH